MTTRVENTESHIAQGKVTRVAKGILKLIPLKPDDLLKDSSVRISFGTAHYVRISNRDTDLKPIIVSGTEVIKAGDYYLQDNEIFKAQVDFTRVGITTNKILVMPTQFSLHQLLAIESRKFQEDEETLIECEQLSRYPNSLPESFIKTNREGFVTLYKVEKKVFTQREIQEVLSKFRHNTLIEVFDIEKEFDKLFNSKN